MNNSADTAAGGIVAVVVLVYVLFIAAAYAFTIWVFWRILSKAGMQGALSLLNLIPFGTIVILCILAFSDWPIERQLKAFLAGGIGPNPQIPPSAPGSTITPA